jgi:hypothetical protein
MGTTYNKAMFAGVFCVFEVQQEVQQRCNKRVDGRPAGASAFVRLRRDKWLMADEAERTDFNAKPQSIAKIAESATAQVFSCNLAQIGAI